jgi:hypothetical protein
MAKTEYKLGNWLRGFFRGRFASDEMAWIYLSNRFLLSYPSEQGRHVYMSKMETIYGIEQYVICREGTTSLEKKSRAVVLRLCKRV